MSNLFAYGTLMCDDIMQEVSKQTLSGERALLKDYSRRRVVDQPYPALIESSGEQLWGVLFRAISEDVWQRLDRFEGKMYGRQPVEVKLASGEIAEAETYVIKHEYREIVATELWDYERFLAEGRQQFEAGYVGYKAL